MTELHPEVADLDPRLRPLSVQAFDLAGVDVVVNTPALRPLRWQPPLRRTADLRSAAGARGRAHGGRLHDPRVGRGARRALRAGRRRHRASVAQGSPGECALRCPSVRECRLTWTTAPRGQALRSIAPGADT